MPDNRIEFRFDVRSERREMFEIEELRVEQVRRDGVAERGEQRTADVRDLAFEFLDQPFDARSF